MEVIGHNHQGFNNVSTGHVDASGNQIDVVPLDKVFFWKSFKANCKSCHKLDAKLVGPGLAGVSKRAPSVQWIKDWVKNSAKVIARGDEYAVKIYEEYQKSQMTAFTSLNLRTVTPPLA